MQVFRKKFIYFIIFLVVFSLICPFYCFASDTTYVWSDFSSPTVETVNSLNQDKRKFFEPYMW